MTYAAAVLAAGMILAVNTALAAPPGVKVQAEGVTVSAACAGGEARIEGNHNVVQLSGACRAVSLYGAANTVTADLASGAMVHIEGSDNTFTYTNRAGAVPPVASVSGERDLVVAKVSAPAPAPVASVPAAIPAPAVLELSGDDQQRDLDCAGRAVVVRGARSRVTLRGGCRSLSVTGDTVTVVAEMQPHAEITLDGSGSTVTYSAAGPVTVHTRGTGSEVFRAKPPG